MNFHGHERISKVAGAANGVVSGVARVLDWGGGGGGEGGGWGGGGVGGGGGGGGGHSVITIIIDRSIDTNAIMVAYMLKHTTQVNDSSQCGCFRKPTA